MLSFIVLSSCIHYGFGLTRGNRFQGCTYYYLWFSRSNWILWNCFNLWLLSWIFILIVHSLNRLVIARISTILQLLVLHWKVSTATYRHSTMCMGRLLSTDQITMKWLDWFHVDEIRPRTGPYQRHRLHGPSRWIRGVLLLLFTS